MSDDVVNMDEENWHVLPSSALDRIGGETWADVELHLRARAAFLPLLRDDPDVTALFTHWNETTSFGQAATALGLHFHRVAAEAGYASVANLLAAAHVATEHDARGFTRVIRDDADLLGAYADAFEGFDLTPLYDEACVLVRETWRLPWPWIALELVRLWGDHQVFGVFGESVQTRLAVQHRGTPAPALSFATRPGESIPDAWRRLRDEVIVPLAAAAAAAVRPPGKRSGQEIVTRYVGWSYRCRIRRESIRSIAGKVDDRRALVKHGIGRAEHWLSIGTWTFDDEQLASPGNGRGQRTPHDLTHGHDT